MTANSTGFGSLILQFARAFLRHCLKRLADGSHSSQVSSPPASAEPASLGHFGIKSRQELSRAYRLCTKQADHLLNSEVIEHPTVQHAYVQARCFSEAIGWALNIPDCQGFIPKHLIELEKAEGLMDSKIDQNECAGR